MRGTKTDDEKKKPNTVASRTFEVKVADEGENFLVRLPFDVRAVFGQARPPVVITVNGYSFRSTVAVYGGEYFIGIRRSHREAAGLEPKKSVSITLTGDDQPRVVDPPRDLADALKKNTAARAAWDALSFSHKREHVAALEEAKKPETRARRIESTLAMLLSKPSSKKSAVAKEITAKKPEPRRATKKSSAGRAR
jgi:hypothetical protein